MTIIDKFDDLLYRWMIFKCLYVVKARKHYACVADDKS